MYVYTYTHTDILYTCMHVYMYTSIHIYIYTCIHMYTYTYIHIYIRGEAEILSQTACGPDTLFLKMPSVGSRHF